MVLPRQLFIAPLLSRQIESLQEKSISGHLLCREPITIRLNIKPSQRHTWPAEVRNSHIWNPVPNPEIPFLSQFTTMVNVLHFMARGSERNWICFCRLTFIHIGSLPELGHSADATRYWMDGHLQSPIVPHLDCLWPQRITNKIHNWIVIALYKVAVAEYCLITLT